MVPVELEPLFQTFAKPHYVLITSIAVLSGTYKFMNSNKVVIFQAVLMQGDSVIWINMIPLYGVSFILGHIGCMYLYILRWHIPIWDDNLLRLFVSPGYILLMLVYEYACMYSDIFQIKVKVKKKSSTICICQTLLLCFLKCHHTDDNRHTKFTV